MNPFLAGLVCALALLGAAQSSAAASAAASAPHRAPKAALPSANFYVEWRIQPVAAPAANAGGWTVGTRDAATGTSGFGPGAVVVGTAKAPAPQGVRVANGKEAELQLDVARTHAVYDMTWSAQSESASASGASPASQSHAQSNGASSHDVTVHQVRALRVTPHWTHGDSLSLDLELTHAGPVAGVDDAGAHSERNIGLRSTVQLSFDEWQGVATVGDGSDELQVRVSWH